MARDHDGPLHAEHRLAALIDTAMLYLYGASISRKIGFLNDGGFGIDGVSMKNREEVPHIRISEGFSGASAHIALAHSNHQTYDDGAFH